MTLFHHLLVRQNFCSLVREMLPEQAHSPIVRPLHSLVRYKQRHTPIKALFTSAAKGVEDSRPPYTR